jgi:hypothetical protein
MRKAIEAHQLDILVGNSNCDFNAATDIGVGV